MRFAEAIKTGEHRSINLLSGSPVVSSPRPLLERLIYLDPDFVSRLYETEFKVNPETKITRTQGLHASAAIPVFSGGGSSSESRTYGVSTMEMLEKLEARMQSYPDFSDMSLPADGPSKICWLSGHLSIGVITHFRKSTTITILGRPASSTEPNNGECLGEERYFRVHAGSIEVALSPKDDYFASGVSAFRELTKIAVEQLALPCRALVRVFAASTPFGERLATPLVILDSA